jgi:hypothetical protein
MGSEREMSVPGQEVWRCLIMQWMVWQLRARNIKLGGQQQTATELLTKGVARGVGSVAFANALGTKEPLALIGVMSQNRKEKQGSAVFVVSLGIVRVPV